MGAMIRGRFGISSGRSGNDGVFLVVSWMRGFSHQTADEGQHARVKGAAAVAAELFIDQFGIAIHIGGEEFLVGMLATGGADVDEAGIAIPAHLTTEAVTFEDEALEGGTAVFFDEIEVQGGPEAFVDPDSEQQGGGALASEVSDALCVELGEVLKCGGILKAAR
jgi:hypothetical protein